MSNAENQKIQSQQFGELEVSKINIFNFPDGVHGFESEKRFILINDEKIAPFKWLISMDNPNIGFPIVSPWLVNLEFEIDESVQLEERIPMVVVNTMTEGGKMTANLKAPIFLDVNSLTGTQEIIENSKWTTEELIKEI